MNPLSIVEQCRTRGIDLFLEGETPRFRCPRGAMTGGLRTLLASHREGIITFLRDRRTLLEELLAFDDQISERMPIEMRSDRTLKRLTDELIEAWWRTDQDAMRDAMRRIARYVELSTGVDASLRR